MRMSTIALPVGELELTTDVAGPPEGELVLMLHGFPQTRYTWRRELTALADRGFRAVAPDQRGYSPGARPESIDAYRVENLVGDALGVAEAMNAERFHLVGHDWGGQLAWVLAALHPERVITLSIVSRPHPRAFVAAMKADKAQSARSKHHTAFQRSEVTAELLADGAARLRQMYRGAGVPSGDADEYLSTLSHHAALDAAINWYRAVGASKIQATQIPAVTVPTLYVWGTDDQTVGRQAAEGTGDWVDAHYRFVELPGVGHFVTDEAPDAFAPLLIDRIASRAGKE